MLSYLSYHVREAMCSSPGVWSIYSDEASKIGLNKSCLRCLREQKKAERDLNELFSSRERREIVMQSENSFISWVLKKMSLKSPNGEKELHILLGSRMLRDDRDKHCKRLRSELSRRQKAKRRKDKNGKTFSFALAPPDKWFFFLIFMPCLCLPAFAWLSASKPTIQSNNLDHA